MLSQYFCSIQNDTEIMMTNWQNIHYILKSICWGATYYVILDKAKFQSEIAKKQSWRFRKKSDGYCWVHKMQQFLEKDNALSFLKNLFCFTWKYTFLRQLDLSRVFRQKEFTYSVFLCCMAVVLDISFFSSYSDFSLLPSLNIPPKDFSYIFYVSFISILISLFFPKWL